MKTIAMCALALLLTTGAASAEGLSITANSDDPNTEMGPRHEARDARLAITSRNGSVVLLLLDDAVAVQLSDRALAEMDAKKNKDAGFFEELLVAGVKLAVGKSIEYPTAHLRAIDVHNGTLRLISDQNKPVFADLKVNGTDVLRDFSGTDASRLVSAYRNRRIR